MKGPRIQGLCPSSLPSHLKELRGRPTGSAAPEFWTAESKKVRVSLGPHLYLLKTRRQDSGKAWDWGLGTQAVRSPLPLQICNAEGRGRGCEEWDKGWVEHLLHLNNCSGSNPWETNDSRIWDWNLSCLCQGPLCQETVPYLINVVA